MDRTTIHPSGSIHPDLKSGAFLSGYWLANAPDEKRPIFTPGPLKSFCSLLGAAKEPFLQMASASAQHDPIVQNARLRSYTRSLNS